MNLKSAGTATRSCAYGMVIVLSVTALSLGRAGVIRAGEELMGVSGLIWTTNRALNNVVRFDAATGVVRGSSPVERAPIGITVPPGTGKVHVSNEGSNTVSVLSASNLTLLNLIVTGPRPHHIIHDPSGRFVYVAEFSSNTVGLIDTRTDNRVAGLTASTSLAARTHAAWPSRDGMLYAVSEGSNELAAIDTRTRQLAWTLPIGNRPSEVLVTPDGRTAYVSIRNEDKVKVVDLASRRVTGDALVGTQPDTLQLTADGKSLIIALRGTPAQLAFVDTATLRVTWVDVGGTTTGHQWLTDDSRFTFVAVEGPGNLGSVAAVDNLRRKLVTVYPYPSGGQPHGVFFEPRR